MPNWLYAYFRDTVEPLIKKKDSRDSRSLAQPESFTSTLSFAPSSFWIHPPEPAITLSHHRFDPPALYQPRIFLWLPHFFVKTLSCPQCGKPLEKNGALRPRRIIDVKDSFYIVAWAYYCRQGCRSHFHGWSWHILDTLPAYLRLAFPATLSHRGGLSKNVITQLRVCNQHKMGPSGVRSLLYETHTLHFSVLKAQYCEAIFELVRGRQLQTGETQSTLHSYLSEKYPSFGNFSDPQQYAAVVPSTHYLADMMNKAIELDEAEANQHTACLGPDQLAMDDSHKVNKHIAKLDGVPIFSAMWTCMDSHYIRAQALTLTKAHEERAGPLMGIANSIKLYGHDDPRVVFSDDPVKDKHLVYGAFPNLAKGLTPMAAAHGLKALELPDTLKVEVLDSFNIIEAVCSALMAPLDNDPHHCLCISLDAEWNVSRTTGVSIIQIAPHSDPDSIFIIPIHKFHDRLPPSLLRLLVNDRVFKIGSAIKADLTRLRKQCPQLSEQTSFNTISLKEYAIQRGVIKRSQSGALDVLAEKLLGVYLSKDESLRRCDQWEVPHIPKHLLQYAALDVFATRLAFQKASEIAPLEHVQHTSPPGTRVGLLVQEGGEIAAYGSIAESQPPSLGNVRIKVPSNSRLLVNVDNVLIPSAGAILHLLSSKEGKTKAGCLTLSQLQAASSSPSFQVVCPLSHLIFDLRDQVCRILLLNRS
jgi:hypothetical protein